jgi:hypothetical protein
MLLLIAQTSLVAAGRVDIHRRLGIAGFLLGCLMVLGVLAATDSLVRAAGPPGRDVQAFYIVPMMGMVIFATLPAFAFRLRRDPAASNDGAVDCRSVALALRYPQSKVADGSALHLLFLSGPGELRPVVHAEDSSGHALGWRVRDHAATELLSYRPIRRLARVRQLGADSRALTAITSSSDFAVP